MLNNDADGNKPPKEPAYKIAVERPIPKSAQQGTEDAATQPTASTSATQIAPAQSSAP
jgi:hypothetical protein